MRHRTPSAALRQPADTAAADRQPDRIPPARDRPAHGQPASGQSASGQLAGGQLVSGGPGDGQAATWSSVDNSGTLLAVFPVNGGSARMAIVGYLLPRVPVPVAPVPPADAARAVGARRPAGAVRLAGAPPAAALRSAGAGRSAGAIRPVTALHPGRSWPAPAPSSASPAPVPLAAGGLVLDTAGRRVLVGGRDAGLVYLEFELLQFLVVNAGRALTRAEIFKSVWGEEPYEATRTVDIHVHRIRRKLGPEYGRNLVTVRRIGYRYEVPTAD
jgi:Transcriptional regulatory protein, C terminal